MKRRHSERAVGRHCLKVCIPMIVLLLLLGASPAGIAEADPVSLTGKSIFISEERLALHSDDISEQGSDPAIGNGGFPTYEAEIRPLYAESPSVEMLLFPISAEELDAFHADRKQLRNLVGLHRHAPDPVVRLNAISWAVLPSGGWASAVTITSPGAEHLRVAFGARDAPEGMEILVSGNHPDDLTSAEVIDYERLSEDEVIWTIPVEGETIRLELRVPSLPFTSEGQITIERISHIIPMSRVQPQADVAMQTAGSCHIDPICSSHPDAFYGWAAIRLLIPTGAGDTSCTAFFLNNRQGREFVMTNEHCVSTQAQASGISGLYGYRRMFCGGPIIEPAPWGGGMTLVRASYDLDVTLLEMRRGPPFEPLRLGWDPSPVSVGDNLLSFGHPDGFPTSMAFHRARGMRAGIDDRGRFAVFLETDVVQGFTTLGASGSPLISGEYVRAVYWGGVDQTTPCSGGQLGAATPFSDVFEVFGRDLAPHLFTAPEPPSGSQNTSGGGGALNLWVLGLLLCAVTFRTWEIRRRRLGAARF